MGDPLYGWWSENLMRTATLSLRSGTLDANYGLEKLVDGNPASLTKWTTKQGGVYIDHGSAVVVAVAAVVHHDVTAGHANFRFERNATTPFGATPTVKENFTAGADEGDGYKPNVFLDINAAHGSLPSLRHSSVIVDATDNADNLQMGEIFLGSTLHRLVDGFIGQGYQEGPDVETIELLTYGQVSARYKKGFRREHLVARMKGTRAETDVMIEWFRKLTGRAEPMLLIPDSARALVHLGLWDADSLRRTTENGIEWDVTIAFRELSRGLTLPAP